ncbi:MAG: T9SS type A sorting domain-containing protein, partial [Saprospiraceae bacterium]|nr:T9SS type A sorting domain-containing protein [Saprospiraceae bacterium]
TVSVWCKLEQSTGNAQFLVARGNDNREGHFHVQYNQQAFAHKFAGGINQWRSTPGAYSTDLYPTPHGGWHHVVYTFDNRKESLYIDSKLVVEVVFPTQIANNSSPLIFGNGYDTYNNYYRVRGSMDDIGIWNRALSGEEIKFLYFADESAGFKAFFNPVPERLVIRAGKYSESSGYKIRICNDLGKRIYQKSLTESVHEINASELGATSGVYFVYLVNSRNRLVEVQKVIILLKTPSTSPSPKA